MKRPPERNVHDLDSTDTLPVPRLDAFESLPEDDPPDSGPDASTIQARVSVPLDDTFVRTDTFRGPTLAGPLAARPVSPWDLAETLREHEQQLGEARLAVDQANARIAEVEAQLAQAQRRCAELEEENQRLRSTPPPEPAPVQALPPGMLHEYDAMRRQNESLHEALSTMNARLGVQESLLAEAEDALRAARPADSAPPAAAAEPQESSAPLRIDWQARFVELERVLEAQREEGAARLREHEQATQALRAELDVLRGAACPAPVTGGHDSTLPASAQVIPLSARIRVLVREEHGRETVYPLGRHSTIGRTPDNDIQVNANYVSRHHAVLLTSSEHCIVEDLNSTNGIAVNGQRVTRQMLQEGDIVTIGKTDFRYETRA